MSAWLVTLCASRTFNTFIFMSYAASLPVLRPAWGMSGTAAGSISTGFQLGYAVSLLVFSWLADRIGARRVFLWSGWLSAASSIAFAMFARSYLTGLTLYTLVALTQGGTYTTGPRPGPGVSWTGGLRRVYGFRTYRAIELALYHTLGDLPEPQAAHGFN